MLICSIFECYNVSPFWASHNELLRICLGIVVGIRNMLNHES